MDSRSTNDSELDVAGPGISQSEGADLPSLTDLERLAKELDDIDARLADLDRKQIATDDVSIAESADTPQGQFAN